MGTNIEMLSCSSKEEKMEDQDIGLSCNNMILLQQSSVQHCKGMANLNNFVECLGILDSRSLTVDERKNPENIRMQQLVDSNKELRDRLYMEIKELRMLMVKVSQRRHEERMKIYNGRAKKQNNSRRQKKIAEAKLVNHCNKKYGNQEN